MWTGQNREDRRKREEKTDTRHKIGGRREKTWIKNKKKRKKTEDRLQKTENGYGDSRRLPYQGITVK